jgi:hypothetical protein
MLRRQQAEAIIACGKVVMARCRWSRWPRSYRKKSSGWMTAKAAMVGNLMTVLCAESEVQPVINTGTFITNLRTGAHHDFPESEKSWIVDSGRLAQEPRWEPHSATAPSAGAGRRWVWRWRCLPAGPAGRISIARAPATAPV